MRTHIFALAVAMLGTSAAHSSAATIVVDSGDSSIASGILDLVIPGMPGMTFDVDFTRASESFNAIFGTGDPPGIVPFFYNDSVGAIAAGDAIGAFLSGFGLDAVGDSADSSASMMVPYRYSSSPDSIVRIQRYNLPEDSTLTTILARSSLTAGYALFTKVPEPGSLTLFAGMLGIGWFVRRRKQA